MEFYPGETCGCDSFEQSIQKNKENSLQAFNKKNALRDLTPESDKNYMIGLLFIIVGNEDDEHEPTDESIHAQVDLLNRVYSQTEAKISDQSPPSSLLVACTKPIGVRFYIKQIIRNCVLPSGQWHSFDGATTTMAQASTGGTDPDRADRFLNVVISNFSTNGNDPFEWDADAQRLTNYATSGFAAKPRSWADNPSFTESLYYQRVYVQADKIGGDEQTGSEPTHNQLYRNLGFVVPQYFWSGVTLIHELGHLLDLAHTWGDTPAYVWDDAQIDYHQCDRDSQIPDLPQNDGYFRGGITRGQVTASTDIFRPPGNRNVCMMPDFQTAYPVPWSNIMNYGDDDVRTMFTDEQRKEVMNTFEFYPTYTPLTQRAAPIDFTTSSLNKVKSIGTGTRAYIGSTLVWSR